MLTGAADPGLNSGFMGCQLLATALAAECRVLSTPASVQTIPTNANNQDVVSMGCTSARMTRELLPKMWKLVAIQSLALAQAADLRGGDVMGRNYQGLHGLVRSVSPRLTVDRPLYEDISAMYQLLQSAEVQQRLLPPRPPAPA
jgi:tyrosine ammonia-lyase